jgi:glycosyltransferase involved in cell wall biosynthesis
MKVTIVSVQIPFVRGGAEYLTDSLGEKIAARGHRVDQLRIPYKNYPASSIVDHMMFCRLIEPLNGDPDRVIALQFPSYLVPCENKKVWLLHQQRQFYDLWETPYHGYGSTPESYRVRSMIRAADDRCLSEARELYTISPNVADRLRKYNGIEPDGILYPPLLDAEQFSCGDAGDYVFYPSRLCFFKRQHVAVEAMRFVRSDFRLVLAGKPDTETYQRELEDLIRRHHLEDRVQLLGRVSDPEKARLLAHAFAVVYIPIDEDYGFVTLEAFHSAKPVLTFTDSGGVLDFVEHGHNGLVQEPTPEALAEGLEQLWADRVRARDMGRAARETLGRKRIDWDHVLETLLS